MGFIRGFPSALNYFPSAIESSTLSMVGPGTPAGERYSDRRSVSRSWTGIWDRAGKR